MSTPGSVTHWVGQLKEIAAKLDCVPRTVERKLRLIRSVWSREDAS